MRSPLIVCVETMVRPSRLAVTSILIAVRERRGARRRPHADRAALLGIASGARVVEFQGAAEARMMGVFEANLNSELPVWLRWPVTACLAKSFYLAFSRRFNEAIRASDTGLAINPSYANLYSARAAAEISLGRFDQAKSDLQQAMRLSPRDPSISFWQVQLGDVEIGTGRKSRRSLCARGQDGRGESQLGGSPSP